MPSAEQPTETMKPDSISKSEDAAIDISVSNKNALNRMYRDPSWWPAHRHKSLWQGDVIARDKLIDSGALKGHQDYFAERADFCGFCVLTQTCDLVREPRDQCVDHICLAVIRRLTDVFCVADVEKKNIDRTRDLLKKILNHNENKKAYFFLHREPVAEIGEHWVVDLRTIFSLNSQFHYDEILSARMVSLASVYQNKLGWMAGHMFSRVPTKGFDELRSEETERQYLSRLLDQLVEVPVRLPLEKRARGSTPAAAKEK
jgi:hypothetical protein